MLNQSSKFCTLPVSVLERVVLEATSLEPLGPPTCLASLLCTCRMVHSTLDPNVNFDLCARIFTQMFDYRAANRRIGGHAVYTPNLTSQLRKQCLALKHIRAGDIYSEAVEGDLWTAFFMLLENDGKNAAQLFDFGKLDEYVDRFIHVRLWENRDQYNGWPAESTANALAVWIYGMSIDRARLSAMTSEQSSEVKRLILPYILCNIRYPTFHCPDNHFDFPISRIFASDSPTADAIPHGWWPQYRSPDAVREHVDHYGLRLPISAPLLALGARIVFMILCSRALWGSEEAWPADRDEAIARGLVNVHPTKADIAELNASPMVQLYNRGDWDWHTKLSTEDSELEDDGVLRKGLKAISAFWDHDWTRMTACIDPTVLNPHKGHVYTPGTLSGLWKGRLCEANVDILRAFLSSPSFPESCAAQAPMIRDWPVYMNLREHHSINPAIPVVPGANVRDEFDDGICNAWFPTTIDVREENDTIRIHNHQSGLDSVYETYAEGRPNSHDENTCTVCIHRREQEELKMQQRRAALMAFAAQSPSPSSGEVTLHNPNTDNDLERIRDGINQTLQDGPDIDKILDSVIGSDVGPGDDEEWSSFQGSSGSSYSDSPIEAICSGIQDIIVTGETLLRHGQAWHHLLYYGRVRSWDGLIAIVSQRTPATAIGTRHLKIFRGYIVGGKNFVGSMRYWSENWRVIDHEAPFLLTKVQ